MRRKALEDVLQSWWESSDALETCFEIIRMPSATDTPARWCLIRLGIQLAAFEAEGRLEEAPLGQIFDALCGLVVDGTPSRPVAYLICDLLGYMTTLDIEAFYRTAAIFPDGLRLPFCERFVHWCGRKNLQVGNFRDTVFDILRTFDFGADWLNLFANSYWLAELNEFKEFLPPLEALVGDVPRELMGPFTRWLQESLAPTVDYLVEPENEIHNEYVQLVIDLVLRICHSLLATPDILDNPQVIADHASFVCALLCDIVDQGLAYYGERVNAELGERMYTTLCQTVEVFARLGDDDNFLQLLEFVAQSFTYYSDTSFACHPGEMVCEFLVRIINYIQIDFNRFYFNELASDAVKGLLPALTRCPEIDDGEKTTIIKYPALLAFLTERMVDISPAFCFVLSYLDTPLRMQMATLVAPQFLGVEDLSTIPITAMDFIATCAKFASEDMFTQKFFEIMMFYGEQVPAQTFSEVVASLAQVNPAGFHDNMQLIGQLIEWLQPGVPCEVLANYLVTAIAVVRLLPASLEDVCQILSDVMEGFRRCLPTELTDESELFALHTLVVPVFKLGVGNPVHPEIMAQFYQGFFETLLPLFTCRSSPDAAIQTTFADMIQPIVGSGWLHDYSEVFAWIEELLVQHVALSDVSYGVIKQLLLVRSSVDIVHRALHLLTEMARVPRLSCTSCTRLIQTSCAAFCYWGATLAQFEPRRLWDVWRAVIETHQNFDETARILIEWAEQALLRDPVEMVVIVGLLRLPDAENAYARSDAPLRAFISALQRSHD
jgi:hypothetical protein